MAAARARQQDQHEGLAAVRQEARARATTAATSSAATPVTGCAAAGYTSYRWAENLGCRSARREQCRARVAPVLPGREAHNGGHYVNMMNAAYDRVGIGVWVSAGASGWSSTSTTPDRTIGWVTDAVRVGHHRGRDPQRVHPPQRRAAAAGRPVRAADRSRRQPALHEPAEHERQAPGLRRRLAAVFFFPMIHIRFLEIPPTAVGRHRSGPDLPVPRRASTPSSPEARGRPRSLRPGPRDRRGLPPPGARGLTTGSRPDTGRAGPGATLPAVPKNLVIVESPAKARTIERYLGADYQRPGLLWPCPRPAREPRQGQVRRRRRSRLRARVRHLRGPPQAGRRHREGRQGGRTWSTSPPTSTARARRSPGTSRRPRTSRAGPHDGG